MNYFSTGDTPKLDVVWFADVGVDEQFFASVNNKHLEMRVFAMGYGHFLWVP